MDKTNVIRLIGLFVGVVVMIFLGRWWAQSMLYPVPRFSVPEVPPEGWREVSLPVGTGGSESGEPAWFFAAESGPSDHPAIVYFHGNGENLATLMLSGQLGQLQGLGAPVLVVDYPGYGRTPGSPSEAAIIDQGCRAVDWLHAQCPDRPIVLAGWSLGAAVAVGTAHRCGSQIRALMLMSAWDSLPEVAETHFPRFLVRLLLREEYPSVHQAPKLEMPVLMLHGVRDPLIPIAHGEALRDAFGGWVTWIAVPGAEHNDLLGIPMVWDEIAAFYRGLSHDKSGEPME